MNTTQYLPIAGYRSNPAFSEIAVLPSSASLVVIGGQNSVSADRQIVGKGDALVQAQTIKERIEAALMTSGCTWADVVRLQVHMVATVDPRSVFQVFQPVLSLRAAPPLVGVYKVQELAHPDFLLEIGVEAVKP